MLRQRRGEEREWETAKALRAGDSPIMLVSLLFDMHNRAKPQFERSRSLAIFSTVCTALLDCETQVIQRARRLTM